MAAAPALASVIVHPAAERRPAAVQAVGVTKAFGATPVLRGIDLTVRRGESVAVVGANGCGKSTLLRCCLRLVEPDAGRILVFGQDVGTLAPRALRQVRAEVGFVFQRHNLVGRLSVLSNVVHGAQARGAGVRRWHQMLAPRADREEAMHCLARVGLAHLAGRRADQLSGGQSQRVAIARALMQRPTLVLADEPVASLDPRAGEEVMDLFVELIRGDGITLVFVSHNPAHALTYADRVVAMAAGRIVLDQPARGLDLDDIHRVYR